jgi:xylulokinase
MLKGGKPLSISNNSVGQNYIVTDFGTTHIKSAVFDSYGHLLELRKTPTPESRDEFGNVYDPLAIYDVVSGQISYLLKHFDNVKGISITGMSEAGLIISRKENTEKTPILPWFDKRTEALAEQAGKDKEIDNFYRTGLRNSHKYLYIPYL